MLLVQESEQQQRAWLWTQWLCWRSLEAVVRRQPLPEHEIACLSASQCQTGGGGSCKHTGVYYNPNQAKLWILRFAIRLQLCFLLGLSCQAGRSWQLPDCPLQPICQHSRLASLPGWGSGRPPRCYGGAQLTYAASLLFRPDPENTKKKLNTSLAMFVCTKYSEKSQ